MGRLQIPELQTAYREARRAAFSRSRFVRRQRAEGEAASPALPPLLWIEILSPEDRPIRVNRKVREALDFGTPYVWVIDPESLESELHTAEGHRALDDGVLDDAVLRIPGSGIEVPLNKLYGE